MKIQAKYITMLLAVLFIFNSCQKEDYKLADLVMPTGVEVTYTIAGVDGDNPYGDGSGFVHFTATANDEITFRYIFGDGKADAISGGGAVSHQFSVNGVNTYNVTVMAIGTGGLTASKTIQVEVFSSFKDDEALEFLTGGSSKTWYWAADQPGHAGMGTTGDDYGNMDYTFASWWSAGPFEKSCMYDAEFVFTKTGESLTFEQTAGPAFIPGDMATSMGLEPDDCYGSDVVPELLGVKNVSFSPSSSKAATDGGYRQTSMSFSDGGFLCWYVGVSDYDIIEVTENILRVRVQQNNTVSWYHTFTSTKPVQ